MSLIASDQFRIVVGLGKSGMSLVRFLANRGIAFAVADTREQPPELDTLRRDYPQVEVRCGEAGRGLPVPRQRAVREPWPGPGHPGPAAGSRAWREAVRRHRAVRPARQGADRCE